MKKRKILALLACLTLTLACGVTASAHQGRLDGNGGHHKRADNTYHYHRGSDRTIEYSSPVSSTKGASASYTASTKSSAVQSNRTAQTPVIQPDYFVLSPIKTIVNGYEMPTFSHSALGGAYIIAEDLKDYGFDTNWDDVNKTLSIVKKADKALNPLPISYYKSFGIGYKFFKVNPNNTIRILFKNTPEDTGYAPACFSCDGYMAVSIDELKAFTEDWYWSDTENSLTLSIR